MKRLKTNKNGSILINIFYLLQVPKKEPIVVIKKEHRNSETELEVDGTKEVHVTLSPRTPGGDPPETEELIKAMMELENTASSDAAVRERIASLPPEVSEVSLLANLADREAADQLSIAVNEAATLLAEYNGRLQAEMEDRRRLIGMLRDYENAQTQLLQQAQQTLQVSFNYVPNLPGYNPKSSSTAFLFNRIPNKHEYIPTCLSTNSNTKTIEYIPTPLAKTKTIEYIPTPLAILAMRKNKKIFKTIPSSMGNTPDPTLPLTSTESRKVPNLFEYDPITSLSETEKTFENISSPVENWLIPTPPITPPIVNHVTNALEYNPTPITSLRALRYPTPPITPPNSNQLLIADIVSGVNKLGLKRKNNGNCVTKHEEKKIKWSSIS